MKRKVLIFFLFMVALLAQTTKKNEITGKVADNDTKQSLIGVNIYVQNKNIGTTTNDKGEFIIQNVPDGNHTIIFSYIGYKKVIKTDVVVRPGRNTYLEINMHPESVEMENVVVTGGYFNELDEKPLSAINYSSEEVRRAPGAGGDIGRIISSLPSVAKTNDQRNSLIVRGGSPVENTTYLDNIEIPNINHFPVQGNSGGGISLIDVDFLNDVTFSAGGFSASYGDRLSSIMELKYREGDKQRFFPQVNVSLKGLGVSAEGPIVKDKMSFMFSANRSYLDFLLDAAKAEGAVPKYYDAQGKISWNLNENNKISIINLFSDDYTSLAQDKALESKENSYGTTKARVNTLGLNWQLIWGKNGYSNTSFSHTYQHFKYDLFKTLNQSRDFYNISNENTISIRNVNYLKFSENFKIETGLEAKYGINDFDLQYGQDFTEDGSVKPVFNIKRDLKTFKGAAFVTLNFSIASRLSLMPGVRYDYFDYNKKSLVSPRLAVSYRLNDITSLNAAAGIYYQNIPALMLVQSDAFKNIDVPKVYQYVAGFNLMLNEDTKLSIEAYDKEYRNFPMDTQSPYKFLLDNSVAEHVVRIDGNIVSTGEAYARGVEIVLQKKMAKDFYGLVSASYSETKYKDLMGNWKYRIYDNKWMFSVEGGYKPSETWDLSVKWLFAGGAPFTQFDKAQSTKARTGIYDIARYNAERMPAYHSLTVRVDKRFNFNSSSLVVYCDIWNVYNRQNIASYEWSEISNNIKEIKQWDTLPVIGIEYEF